MIPCPQNHHIPPPAPIANEAPIKEKIASVATPDFSCPIDPGSSPIFPDTTREGKWTLIGCIGRVLLTEPKESLVE